MKLTGLTTKQSSQVLAEGLLNEISGRVLTFPYANYNLDPKPQVLVLGSWTHPNTGNKLLGGVNLNYMTKDEVEELRGVLPSILKGRNLKQRYWLGRGLSASIFNNLYRTYDRKYIQAVTPSEFQTGKIEIRHEQKPETTAGAPADVPPAPDVPSEPSVADVKATKAAEKADDVIKAIKKDPKKIKAIRKELAKRKAKEDAKKTAEPRPAEPTEPDVAEQPKPPAPQPQSTQGVKPPLIDVERPGPDGLPKDDPMAPPSEDDLGGTLDDLKEGIWRHPTLGVMWESHGAYKRHHSPRAFIGSDLHDQKKPLNAIVDVLSGEVLVDCADPEEIMLRSGFDPETTALMVATDGQIAAYGHPPRVYLTEAARTLPDLVAGLMTIPTPEIGLSRPSGLLARHIILS